MKAIFGILVAAVFAISAAMYFDFVAENQVYKFCNLHGSGNTLDEVQQKAEQHQFSWEMIDANNLKLSNDNYLTFFEQYVCLVNLEQGRVVAQSMQKQ